MDTICAFSPVGAHDDGVHPARLPLAVHEGTGHVVADEARRDALEGKLEGGQTGSLLSIYRP